MILFDFDLSTAANCRLFCIFTYTVHIYHGFNSQNPTKKYERYLVNWKFSKLENNAYAYPSVGPER